MAITCETLAYIRNMNLIPSKDTPLQCANCYGGKPVENCPAAIGAVKFMAQKQPKIWVESDQPTTDR